MQEKLTFLDSLTIKNEDDDYFYEYQSNGDLQDPQPEGANVFTLFSASQMLKTRKFCLFLVTPRTYPYLMVDSDFIFKIRLGLKVLQKTYTIPNETSLMKKKVINHETRFVQKFNMP